MKDLCVSNFITPLANAPIHQKCLESLRIDVYKYLNDLSSQMKDIFKLQKNIYNLRNVLLFESQDPRTKRYGLL